MPDADLVRVPCPLCDAAASKPERTVNGFALERCQRCQFVFVNPQYTSDALNRLYTVRDADKLVQLYSRIASPWVIADYNRTLDWLERLEPKRGRMLDFACAAGYFHEQAAKRGWDAHGTDVGAWAAQAAAARGLKNLHVGNLFELKFPIHHFDVIHAAQVFEHLARPKDELAELKRILRPGGLLYIDVPNYRTLPIMLGKDDFRLNMPPQHVNYFTPRTLRSLLKSADFRDIRIRSDGGLKWENLVGQRMKSDIWDAHKPSTSTNGAQQPSINQPVSDGGPVRLLKRAVVGGFIRPVCYDAMKLGMNLIAVARRPE